MLLALQVQVHFDKQTPDVVLLLLCISAQVLRDLISLALSVVDFLFKYLTMLHFLKDLFVCLFFIART